MKTLLKKLLPVALFALLISLTVPLLSPPAKAQSVQTFSAPGVSTAAIGGTSISNSWAIVPIGAGVPRIQFLAAGSDKQTAILTFYTNAPVLTINASIAAAQSNIGGTAGQLVSNLNYGLTNGDTIVVKAGNKYTRHSVYSATATNFLLDSPLTNALNTNDIIYRAGAAGRILAYFATATNQLNANSGGIFNGNAQGLPVLVQVDSGTNGHIGTISGIYQR